MNDAPDFPALRAKRDDAINRLFDAVRDKLGAIGKNVTMHAAGAGGCYCDCANGGPCEHDFAGWREFEAPRHGGEQVCTKCGCGAVTHTVGCW